MLHGTRGVVDFLFLQGYLLEESDQNHKRDRKKVPGGGQENQADGVFSDRTSVDRILYSVFSYETNNKELLPLSL